jgi:hypothetical protein
VERLYLQYLVRRILIRLIVLALAAFGLVVVVLFMLPIGGNPEIQAMPKRIKRCSRLLLDGVTMFVGVVFLLIAIKWLEVGMRNEKGNLSPGFAIARRLDDVSFWATAVVWYVIAGARNLFRRRHFLGLDRGQRKWVQRLAAVSIFVYIAIWIWTLGRHFLGNPWQWKIAQILEALIHCVTIAVASRVVVALGVVGHDIGDVTRSKHLQTDQDADGIAKLCVTPFVAVSLFASAYGLLGSAQPARHEEKNVDSCVACKDKARCTTQPTTKPATLPTSNSASQPASATDPETALFAVLAVGMPFLFVLAWCRLRYWQHLELRISLLKEAKDS